MGLGLLTVLVIPSGRAEPLRTPEEEEEEDRYDEEEEDEHRHAVKGGEGDAPIRIFLRIFHPHRVHHLVDRLDGVDGLGLGHHDLDRLLDGLDGVGGDHLLLLGDSAGDLRNAGMSGTDIDDISSD